MRWAPWQKMHFRPGTTTMGLPESGTALADCRFARRPASVRRILPLARAFSTADDSSLRYGRTRDLRMTPAEALSASQGSEGPLVIGSPGAGTLPLDLTSRKRFSSADDSPVGPTRHVTERMTSAEGSSMPRGSEGESSLRAASDVVRVQPNVAKTRDRPSPIGSAQSPAIDVGEMPEQTVEREDRSRHVQVPSAESDFWIGRGADMASPSMGSSVQRSVTMHPESARTSSGDSGDSGPGASDHATPRRAMISLPATAAARYEPSPGTADNEPSRGRLNSWPSSGSDAESIDRSSHHGMSLPVVRAGNSTVFPNATSPTATPSSLSAATPAMDLPVARISRAQAQGGTQDSGSTFRQPSANPPPPSSIVHTLPGYSSSTARVSRAADDATSPPSPQPTAAQPGEQASPPDLKALARDLYPLIRRMLVIEKERLPHL